MFYNFYTAFRLPQVFKRKLIIKDISIRAVNHIFIGFTGGKIAADSKPIIGNLEKLAYGNFFSKACKFQKLITARFETSRFRGTRNLFKIEKVNISAA